MSKYRTEYKLVDVQTLKGLQQAERLQRYGWTVERASLFSVLMKKRFERKTRRSK